MFYDCVEYMDEIRKAKGKVLVHCVQGVSRSTTICLAYLIWKENMNYEQAYEYIRARRGIASPNLGFTIQLINFHRRIRAPYEEQASTNQPKCFAATCHQLEDPSTIVVRLLNKFYTVSQRTSRLDPRGIFVIGDDKQAFIWIGSECHKSYKELFYNKTKEYLPKLQKYENFPTNVTELNEGEETIEFWKIFGLAEEPSIKCEYNNQWNQW